MWQSTMLGPWIFPACTYVLCNSWMQKDREKFKDALELQTRKTKSYAVHNMQTPCYKSWFSSGDWASTCSVFVSARNGMWVISKVQSVQSVRPLPRWHPRLWVWVMRTKRNQWWFIALVAFAVPWKKYQKSICLIHSLFVSSNAITITSINQQGFGYSASNSPLRWVCWCYAQEGRVWKCVQVAWWCPVLWELLGCSALARTFVCFWSSRQHCCGQLWWSFSCGKMLHMRKARCVELPQLQLQSHHGGLQRVYAVHEGLLLFLEWIFHLHDFLIISSLSISILFAKVESWQLQIWKAFDNKFQVTCFQQSHVSLFKSMGFLTQGANCQNSSSIRPFDADRRKGRGPGLFLPAAEVETQDKGRGNDKFCCFGVGTVDVFDVTKFVTKCVCLQLWSVGLIVLSQFIMVYHAYLFVTCFNPQFVTVSFFMLLIVWWPGTPCRPGGVWYKQKCREKGKTKKREVIPVHLNTADHDKNDDLDHHQNSSKAICGQSSSFFTVWQQKALAAIIGKNTNAGYLFA